MLVHSDRLSGMESPSTGRAGPALPARFLGNSGYWAVIFARQSSLIHTPRENGSADFAVQTNDDSQITYLTMDRHITVLAGIFAEPYALRGPSKTR